MTSKPPLFYFLVPLVGFLFAILCIDSGHNIHDDFALYLEQARAIISGGMSDVYSTNFNCMEYAGSTTGPDIYPFGYPLLLSPFFIFFDTTPWFLLKAYTFLLYFPFLWAFYNVLRHFELTSFQFKVVFILVALNYHLIRFADWLYADVPFMSTAMLGILFTLRFKEKPIFRNLLILTIILCFHSLLKSQGIILLSISTLYLLLYSRLRLFAFMIPITFLLAIFSLDHLYPFHDTRHWELLTQINISSITSNLYYYTNEVGTLFLFHRFPTYITFFVGMISLAIIGYSFYKKYRPFRFIFLFLIMHGAACILWPSFQGMRLIFPILPFLILFLVLGIQELISNRFIRPILNSLVTLNGLLCIITSIHYWKINTDFYTSPTTNEIVQYIHQNIPSDKTISFVRPRGLRYILNSKHVITQDPTLAEYIIQNDRYLKPYTPILFRSREWILIEK